LLPCFHYHDESWRPAPVSSGRKIGDRDVFDEGVKRTGGWSVVLMAACLVAPLPGAEPPNPVTAEELGSPDVAARARAATPLVLLLRDPAVRSELKLSADQSAAIDRALADVDYPLWYVRDAKDAETQVKCARAYDHLQKQLEATLQPQQRRRLEGIVLQAYGWPAILLPTFADPLQLTADQSTRIRELLEAPEPEKSVRPTDRPKATQERLRAVLSESQQSRLAQLTGVPFRVSAIRKRYCRAPEFAEVAEWINSGPLDRAKLHGKVTAVHFWALGCINCVRNLPHYQSWQEKYAGKGLLIVGLHTPETEAERVVESVRAKVAAENIAYPVGVDGAAKNWNAWATRWWPSVYLVDKRGYVRYWWYGELNWQGANGEEYMRQKIEELLAERD
jgi:thiol-disulfide isomerase/thioredoxin